MYGGALPHTNYETLWLMTHSLAGVERCNNEKRPESEKHKDVCKEISMNGKVWMIERIDDIDTKK